MGRNMINYGTEAKSLFGFESHFYWCFRMLSPAKSLKTCLHAEYVSSAVLRADTDRLVLSRNVNAAQSYFP